MARQLLSDAQRRVILEAHFHLSEKDRARYWTLSADDLHWIAHRRRDENRFGFAVQLCLLRFPGWPLGNARRVPADLLQFVAVQLEMPLSVVDEFYRRRQTRNTHLQEIQDLFGFKPWTLVDQSELGEFLFPLALRSDDGMRLMIAGLEELRRRRVVLPALGALEYVVWNVKDRAEKEVYQLLDSSLTALQRRELNELLIPDAATSSGLTWLRQAPGPPSAATILEAFERLDSARGFEVTWPPPDQIHRDRIIALAQRGERHTLQHLRDYPEPKRLAIVTSFLLLRQEELTDEIIDLHHSLLARSFNRAGHQLLSRFHGNGPQINNKLYEYQNLGAALLLAKEKGLSLSNAVEQAVGWETVSIGEIASLVASPEFSNIEELTGR